MQERNDLAKKIEAILFAAGDSVKIERLAEALSTDPDTVIQEAQNLSGEYMSGNCGIRILRLDDSFQMCSAPECADDIIRTLEHRRPPMLSQPALETLAVIAYFQPVTRAYVDQIRGVDSNYTVNSLIEKGLIEQCGRLDVPGRPALYSTTDVFLKTMNISSIEELPQLPDVSTDEGIEELKARIAELQSDISTDQIAIADL